MSTTVIKDVAKIRKANNLHQLKVDPALAKPAKNILKNFLERSLIEAKDDFVIFGLSKEDTVMAALTKYDCLKRHILSKNHTTFNWSFHGGFKIWIFIFGGGHEPEFDREAHLLNIYMSYARTDKSTEEIVRCAKLGSECEKIMSCIKKGKGYPVEEGCEIHVFLMKIKTNFSHHISKLFENGFEKKPWKRFNMKVWTEKKQLRVLFLFFNHEPNVNDKEEKETILGKLNKLRSSTTGHIKMDPILNFKATIKAQELVYIQKEQLSMLEYIHYTKDRNDHFGQNEMNEILKNEKIVKFGVYCIKYIINEEECYAWVYLFSKRNSKELKQWNEDQKRKKLESLDVYETLKSLRGGTPLENAQDLNEEAKLIYNGLLDKDTKITTNDMVCFETENFSSEYLKRSNAYEYITSSKFESFGYHCDDSFWILLFRNKNLLKGKNSRDKRRILMRQREKCLCEIVNLYRELHECKRMILDQSMENFIHDKLKKLTKGEKVTCNYNILTFVSDSFEEASNALLSQYKILNSSYTYFAIAASDTAMKDSYSIAIGISNYTEEQRKFLMTTTHILFNKMNESRVTHKLPKLKNNKEMEKMAAKRLECVLNNKKYVDSNKCDFTSFPLILNSGDSLEDFTCLVENTELYLKSEYREVGIAQAWGFVVIYFSPSGKGFNLVEAEAKLFAQVNSMNVQTIKMTSAVRSRLEAGAGTVNLSGVNEPNQENSDEDEDECSQEEEEITNPETVNNRNPPKIVNKFEPKGFDQEENELLRRLKARRMRLEMEQDENVDKEDDYEFVSKDIRVQSSMEIGNSQSGYSMGEIVVAKEPEVSGNPVLEQAKMKLKPVSRRGSEITPKAKEIQQMYVQSPQEVVIETQSRSEEVNTRFESEYKLDIVTNQQRGPETSVQAKLQDKQFEPVSRRGYEITPKPKEIQQMNIQSPKEKVIEKQLRSEDENTRCESEYKLDIITEWQKGLETNVQAKLQEKQIKPVINNTLSTLPIKMGHVRRMSFNYAQNLNKPTLKVERSKEPSRVTSIGYIPSIKTTPREKSKLFALQRYESRASVRDIRSIFQNKEQNNDSRTKRDLKRLSGPSQSNKAMPSTNQVNFTVDANENLGQAMSRIKSNHGSLIEKFNNLSIAKDTKSRLTVISFSKDLSVDEKTLNIINKYRRDKSLTNLLPSKKLCDICFNQLEKGYVSKTLNYGLFDCLITTESEMTDSASTTFSAMYMNSENVKRLILNEDFKYFGMAYLPLKEKNFNVWGFCFTEIEPNKK